MYHDLTVDPEIDEAPLGDYNRAEHERVLGAVSRCHGDWDQAFHLLANRGGKVGNISRETFVRYASTKTGTGRLYDQDGASRDIADEVIERLDAEANTVPVYTGCALRSTPPDAKTRTVWDAIHALPRRQFESVVRWVVWRIPGSTTAPLTETEKRQFRRASAALGVPLVDLATGRGERPLRPQKPLPADPFELPEIWEAVRQGIPCERGCTCERHEKPATVYIAPGPEWTRWWVEATPEVPDDWNGSATREEMYAREEFRGRLPATTRYDVMLGDTAVVVGVSRMFADDWCEFSPNESYRVVRRDQLARRRFPVKLGIPRPAEEKPETFGCGCLVDTGCVGAKTSAVATLYVEAESSPLLAA